MNFTDLERLDAPALPVPELPWESIAGRLEQLTIAILRFDARLEASGLAAGWQSRCDLTEAVRALILDGHLVDVGDLVLHDAGMMSAIPLTSSHGQPQLSELGGLR
ncbi:hypothetical protein [Microvirga mediterraneensis]|uniref:Uncharacterized protein n=1 Tax=Microvirga mediterraneensis TaxID=2754695 RepID=A0A838BUA0_9HYPH|nr:hypothetical protein [Microvirga mediterraneensis]MBA1158918.1 hypothetical protein [Microvirga mediterraneensis]